MSNSSFFVVRQGEQFNVSGGLVENKLVPVAWCDVFKCSCVNLTSPPPSVSEGSYIPGAGACNGSWVWLQGLHRGPFDHRRHTAN
jgi:hypothetical protein